MDATNRRLPVKTLLIILLGICGTTFAQAKLLVNASLGYADFTNRPDATYEISSLDTQQQLFRQW